MSLFQDFPDWKKKMTKKKNNKGHQDRLSCGVFLLGATVSDCQIYEPFGTLVVSHDPLAIQHPGNPGTNTCLEKRATPQNPNRNT